MCTKISDQEKLEIVKNSIKSIPDFPKPGIEFKDIFSVLHDPQAFKYLNDLLIKRAKETTPQAECVVGLESRGFLFAPQIALALEVPFVPLRKKGKLPGKCLSYTYSLEYGQDTIEIQEDAIKKGQSVLIVDDLLATGGTLKASCELIAQSGATVSSCLLVIELEPLQGRKLVPAPVETLIKF